MKFKYLFLLIPVMLFVSPANAQEYTESYEDEEITTEIEPEADMNDTVPEIKARMFRFIYVAPDNNMSQQGLINALVDHYNHIALKDIPAIFYLSSRSEPIIMKFNTGDGDYTGDFNDSELIYTLRQSMEYNVTPDYDRERVMEIMNENNFETEDGVKKYEDIELNFHVGKAFWDAGNNEAIIAPVFFGLNAAKYINEGKMQFNVMFRCPQSKGSLNRDTPFGIMNLDGINGIINPRVTD